MSIDQVLTNPPIGSPGSCADTGFVDPVSYILEDDVAPGLFVTQGAAANGAALINAAPDLLLGLVMKAEHISADETTEDGEYKEGFVAPLKKTGRSHVFVKGDYGPALPVYVRYVADADEAVGSLSSVADPGKNRLVPRAAVQFVTSGTDDIAVIEIHVHDDVVDPDET